MRRSKKCETKKCEKKSEWFQRMVAMKEAGKTVAARLAISVDNSSTQLMETIEKGTGRIRGDTPALWGHWFTERGSSECWSRSALLWNTDLPEVSTVLSLKLLNYIGRSKSLAMLQNTPVKTANAQIGRILYGGFTAHSQSFPEQRTVENVANHGWVQ